MTNVSSSSQAVLLRRKVDSDLAPPPTFLNETITSPPLTSPVTGASFGALEDPSPLTNFFSPIPAGGGTFGPGDNGAALQFTLGTMAPGASAIFTIFHVISQGGQSEASLSIVVQ